MAKKKSELQLAAENIASLVKQTNGKINELGNHAYSLNNVLSIIQNQFDKIRNVPSDTKREYENAKEIRLEWKQQVDKIESDYNSAAKVNVSTGAAGTGLGVGVAALGPTAAMSIATTFGVASTGTAISTLSGAAATNAALAWLGGGTLAAGGGGMAGGTALLALAGPVGWSIAGVAILGSGLMFWKARSDKKRLEDLFMNISKRDTKKYELAIVELNERIKRIIKETGMLNTAIVEIGSYGVDYEAMTEQQQYTLGSYVNLMSASAQLLVNPILGLQPNYTEKNLDAYFSSNKVEIEYRLEKKMIVYFANLLYKIETDEKDRKLMAKSFRGNKKFLEQMGFDKKHVDSGLLNLVDRTLKFSYKK
jgi:hypothetical protein